MLHTSCSHSWQPAISWQDAAAPFQVSCSTGRQAIAWVQVLLKLERFLVSHPYVVTPLGSQLAAERCCEFQRCYSDGRKRYLQAYDSMISQDSRCLHCVQDHNVSLEASCARGCMFESKLVVCFWHAYKLPLLAFLLLYSL